MENIPTSVYEHSVCNSEISDLSNGYISTNGNSRISHPQPTNQQDYTTEKGFSSASSGESNQFFISVIQLSSKNTGRPLTISIFK